MSTQNDLEVINRMESLLSEIQEFQRDYSPSNAANEAIQNCVNVVKSRAQMFRSFAEIASNQNRFAINSTIANELFSLARELQTFIVTEKDLNV